MGSAALWPEKARHSPKSLTAVRGELGAVHRLVEHLDGEEERLAQRAALLVLLLQQALGALLVEKDKVGDKGQRGNMNTSPLPPHLRVGADAGGHPAAVVARGVALVQLEAVARVVAHEQDGRAKGPEA